MYPLWAVDNKEILRNICFQRIHGIKRREIRGYQLVYQSKIICQRERLSVVNPHFPEDTPNCKA